ncbi:nucleoside hydrolase-like domain-containing protein [Pontiella sulfatireligans]|uniref:DUF1593 domain-containing protein n=1 Tax=Pontiella sulfatireligans TaxID=2750658 RepID=A0A6C2UTC4_9BACT|nr:nucleoside hydrolase-like domain-containing protein [Pontiella sulfatireligans]VGO23582.1 hypothetical protein SCARR_05689 [Pontiella sulfatireligans]
MTGSFFKSHRSIVLLFLVLLSTSIHAADKDRLVILADMGNEPDEEQQIAHMLMCSNEFEIEGLIAVTGKYIHPGLKKPYKQVVHPELFVKLIDAYEKVLENLRLHAEGWPEPARLRRLVVAGQSGYGIADIGEGKSSPGSDLLLDLFLKDDPRPIWIVLNAGANTLGQALDEFRRAHSREELDRIVAKLRVFENGAQDNAGAWICSEFPKIHWIRSNFQTYAYGGPGGADGDIHTSDFDKLGPYFWQPYAYTTKGQHDWLKEHVMTGHGALGEVYPARAWGKNYAFMEGGGTIPWMGLVNKGLFDINHPGWGGWGGRFSTEKVSCFWSRHYDIRKDEEKTAPFYVYREVSDCWINPLDNKMISGDYVPVWRWRESMFSDFKCRMDWCVKSYAQANHHPVAAVGNDNSDQIIHMTALPGEILSFNAANSSDPDGDSISYTWWQYVEAGTYAGNVLISDPTHPETQVEIPSGAAGCQLHIILEIKDDHAIGSLFDFRRVVIDVDRVYDHKNLFGQK